MAIKEILHYPNPILKQQTDPVEIFDEGIAQLSADLRDTAKAFRAEGLAANQIGALYSMFVIRDFESQEYITCINPQILAVHTDQVDSNEGCLSFPGVLERLKRAESVRVTYQDEGGLVTERWLSGITSVAFQHELDHLQGKLFIDRMGNLQKRLALKRLDKVSRTTKRFAKQIQGKLQKELRKIELAQASKSATV